MNRRLTLHLPALALAAACGLTGCMTPALFADRLQGRWSPEQAELGGELLPLDTFQGAVLTLQGGQYDFVTDQGRYAVLLDGGHYALDVVGTAGPNQGRTIAAIFQIDGDHLTICYELGPGPRPTAFDAPKGTRHFLVRYRRVAAPA